MRCAVVHYWLLGMRGGEKVLESICRVLPKPDIFTLFYDPARVSPFLKTHHIQASCLNRLRRHHRSLLPLMPMALEHFDLREYDLVVSSESGPAKGVITGANTKHVCYCHTPMRYLWDLYPAYVHEWTKGRMKRALMAPFANYLRLWDAASASRVDQFIANSRNVQNRIWKAYRRSSNVLHPPVETERFFIGEPRDYWLLVSELVAYKRVADAVRCFTRTGRKLKVVGGGPEYGELRRIAGSSIEFCGRVSDAELAELYAHCRALVMPGEEDFGIVAVEALASGKPVIALGKGGVLESIPQNESHAGFLYGQPGEDSLEAAILAFEAAESDISPIALKSSANRFSKSSFELNLRRLVLGQTSGREIPSKVVQIPTASGT